MARGPWFADEWDPERDPAVRRTREALQPPPEPELIQPPASPLVLAREEVTSLRDRAAAGDSLAADKLRQWLRRVRRG